MKCITCGLLEKETGRFYCLRFKKEVSPDEAEGKSEWECIYYCKIMTEAGEPLTPRQHLILQDQDLRGKKMRGPV